MFEIDLGLTGSDINEFLSWSARGTQDGAVRARSFYLREGAAKVEFEQAQTKGFVLDLDSLKTGWQKSEGIQGVAPEWKWNASVNQMMAKPGDDWKKGISVKVAVNKDKAVVWEQAGAAVWQVLTDLAAKLKDRPEGKLPHIKMTGSKDIKFTKGSTAYPEFEIVKWVDKPDCLKQGVAAGIALDETPPAAKQPAPAPVMDDDDDFA
jgi:hypothetical protein